MSREILGSLSFFDSLWQKMKSNLNRMKFISEGIENFLLNIWWGVDVDNAIRLAQANVLNIFFFVSTRRFLFIYLRQQSQNVAEFELNRLLWRMSHFNRHNTEYLLSFQLRFKRYYQNAPFTYKTVNLFNTLLKAAAQLSCCWLDMCLYILCLVTLNIAILLSCPLSLYVSGLNWI